MTLTTSPEMLEVSASARRLAEPRPVGPQFAVLTTSNAILQSAGLVTLGVLEVAKALNRVADAMSKKLEAT